MRFITRVDYYIYDHPSPHLVTHLIRPRAAVIGWTADITERSWGIKDITPSVHEVTFYETVQDPDTGDIISEDKHIITDLAKTWEIVTHKRSSNTASLAPQELEVLWNKKQLIVIF